MPAEEIPKEIEELLHCSREQVDPREPLRNSLNQKFTGLVVRRGLGADVDFDRVVCRMSSSARTVLAAGSLKDKLMAFAEFDGLFLQAQQLYIGMIQVALSKVKVYQERYETVENWYETVLALLMDHLLSLLLPYAKNDAQISMFLTEFLEAYVDVELGYDIDPRVYDELIEQFLKGEYKV